MKVAIVHYWLLGMRGGEKVLESLCRIFPQADIFTHVLDAGNISPAIARHTIRTTMIARLPFAKTWYKRYLPLMPFALEQLDLRGYDLVISSESGPAKGVLTDSGCVHVCYCHSPMRYLWDLYQDYLQNAGFLTSMALRLFATKLRIWDYASAARVDHFIANSFNVARRIEKHYRRTAEVVHPPVDIARFRPIDGKYKSASPDAPYVMLGELVRYKRTDLAVQAFNVSGRQLVVIGDGEDAHRLRAMAKPNIHFASRQDDASVVRLLGESRGLIFPGEEDFGIVPLEAMACGRPVVAYGRGGALETVQDGVTGVFFQEQTPEALNEAVERLENNYNHFDTQTIADRAASFDVREFERKLTVYFAKVM